MSEAWRVKPNNASARLFTGFRWCDQQRRLACLYTMMGRCESAAPPSARPRPRRRARSTPRGGAAKAARQSLRDTRRSPTLPVGPDRDDSRPQHGPLLLVRCYSAMVGWNFGLEEKVTRCCYPAGDTIRLHVLGYAIVALALLVTCSSALPNRVRRDAPPAAVEHGASTPPDLRESLCLDDRIGRLLTTCRSSSSPA